MKNILFYTILSVLFISTLNSCDDKQEYDINWPEPEITEVSSYSQPLSSTITLKGNFLEFRSLHFGKVAGEKIKVADDGKSLTVVVPRTIDPEGAPIVVVNEYSQRFETDRKSVV